MVFLLDEVTFFFLAPTVFAAAVLAAADFVAFFFGVGVAAFLLGRLGNRSLQDGLISNNSLRMTVP